MKYIKGLFFNGLFLSIFTLSCRPNNSLIELQKNLSTLTDKLSEMQNLLANLTKPVEIPEIPKKFVIVEYPEKLLYQVGVLPNNTDSLLKGLNEEEKKRKNALSPKMVLSERGKQERKITGRFKILRKEVSDDYRNSGYHALRDGYYVFRYLKADPMERDIGEIQENLKSSEDYAEMLMIAKPDIIKYRTKKKQNHGNGGGWLVKNDLLDLINESIPNSINITKEILFQEMLTWEYNEHITIIEDIENPSKEVTDTIEKLKNETEFNHIFLLAYPDEYKGKSYFEKGKTLHWIVVGVHHFDGKNQYFIADSHNDKKRLESKEFIELKKLLDMPTSGFKTEIDNYLKKAKTHFNSMIALQDQKLATNEAEQLINAIGEAFRLALFNDFFDKPEFDTDKDKLKKYLAQVEYYQYPPNEKIALDERYEKKLKQLGKLLKTYEDPD